MTEDESELKSQHPAPDAESSPWYRESAEQWMNEIKIFIANGDEQKARNEYRLFEQHHPSQVREFNPDFNRRPIVDDLPADGSEAK